jgi:putative sterol carrier protein
MTTYQFLSDEWITATRALREEYAAKIPPSSTLPVLRINLVVQTVPFGTGTINAHFDTSGGEPEIELDHLDVVDATVTSDYNTVKSLLVDGNLGVAMEAFQLGRIQVQGDMMKLMGLAGMNTDPTSIELAKRIREITA